MASRRAGWHPDRSREHRPIHGIGRGLPPHPAPDVPALHDWQHPVGVAAVFAVVRIIEGNVVSPKVIGERLGLHPVVVISAILVGGQVFGFLGILLAVPTTAVIKVFRRGVLAFYRAP